MLFWVGGPGWVLRRVGDSLALALSKSRARSQACETKEMEKGGHEGINGKVEIKIKINHEGEVNRCVLRRWRNICAARASERESQVNRSKHVFFLFFFFFFLRFSLLFLFSFLQNIRCAGRAPCRRTRSSSRPSRRELCRRFGSLLLLVFLFLSQIRARDIFCVPLLLPFSKGAFLFSKPPHRERTPVSKIFERGKRLFLSPKRSTRACTFPRDTTRSASVYVFDVSKHPSVPADCSSFRPEHVCAGAPLRRLCSPFSETRTRESAESASPRFVLLHPTAECVKETRSREHLRERARELCGFVSMRRAGHEKEGYGLCWNPCCAGVQHCLILDQSWFLRVSRLQLCHFERLGTILITRNFVRGSSEHSRI